VKIKLTLKDPDGVYDSVDEAARRVVAGIEAGAGKDAAEFLDKEELEETAREGINKAIKPWVEYGEYVSIEVDTEAGTAIVLKRDA
jgi:hypothetical protein